MPPTASLPVIPRRTARQEVGGFRKVVRELVRETSLREAAERLGVCHATVWKLLKGRRMRPSTLRRIKDGVSRVAGATDIDLLVSGLHGALAPLPKPKRREVRRLIARALTDWYMEEGLLVPGWVTGLLMDQPHWLRQRHSASVQGSLRGRWGAELLAVGRGSSRCGSEPSARLIANREDTQ